MNPYRPEQRVGGDRFVQLLRADFTNFRRVRTYGIAILAAGVAFVLIAFVSASDSRSSNPPVPTGPGGEAVTDTYMFVHQTLVGDGTLAARVTSLSGAVTSPSGGLEPWAKAGIILEPATSQGTAYAAVMVTGSYGVNMQYDYTFDRRALPGAVGPSSPRWLRLTRVGALVTGYDSLDGNHWTQITTVRLSNLPDIIQIGLFVASSDSASGNSSVATANFDHVTTTGDLLGPSWRGDPIGGTDPGVQAGSLWQQESADAFGISGSGDIAPLVGGEGYAIHWSGASIVNGTIFGLLILIVVAASFATSEYRHKARRTTSAANQRRVLAATSVVVGSLAFAVGAMATAVAEVITRHVFAANGNYLFPQTGSDAARVIFGTGLFLGLATVLVVALGTVLRRRTGTVVAGIVLLMLPGILATVFPGSQDWLMGFTPTAAFAIQATLPHSDLVNGAYTIVNGYFPISPWGGLAVLAAYTAVALGAATWLSRSRTPYP